MKKRSRRRGSGKIKCFRCGGVAVVCKAKTGKPYIRCDDCEYLMFPKLGSDFSSSLDEFILKKRAMRPRRRRIKKLGTQRRLITGERGELEAFFKSPV